MENTPKFDIEKIASLAMLSLSEGEKEALSRDMEEILLFASKVTALADADAETLCRDTLRADEPFPSLPREELLQNAKTSRDGCITVPRVIGSEADA